MQALAAILLVGVFVRHFADKWFAQGSDFSATAWNYVLGGTWEVVLCTVLAFIVAGYRDTIWRAFALLAVTIGALEGAQTSTCRLAIQDIRAVPAGQDLCDFVTGAPVRIAMELIYLCAVVTVYVVYQTREG